MRTVAIVAASVVSAPVAASLLLRQLAPERLGLRPEVHAVVRDWAGYYDKDDASEGEDVVRVVVFGDYRCPACREAWAELARLDALDERVVVQWRHYPILGLSSTTASSAAECARDAGEFEAMHSRILEGETRFLSSPAWVSLAIEAGVTDTAAFGVCLLSPTVPDRVSQDLEAGRRLGLDRTPAVLVDSLLFLGSPGGSYVEEYADKVARNEG